MNKQKILEQLIINRKIIRPNIKKWYISLLLFILISSFVFIIWLCITTKLNNLCKIIIGLIFFIIFFEIFMRLLFIEIIKIYQYYAKESIRRRCKCLPSCSEYSIISLRKIFPLVFALAKIKKRLFNTCKGDTYILDYPQKKGEEIYFYKYIETNKNSPNNKT